MATCEDVHELLEQLPTIKWEFQLNQLPRQGIYFFYQRGVTLKNGKPKVVRIGTHTGKSNFRSRIAEHYLIKQNTHSLNTAKPSDRSIFRKNIGRALLNKAHDPYLSVWNIDFTSKHNREQYKHLRDIKKEQEVEEQITHVLKTQFSFTFIITREEQPRLELERRFISCLARCQFTAPRDWLGNYATNQSIRATGLWQTHHINYPRSIKKEEVEALVNQTLEYWDNHTSQ